MGRRQSHHINNLFIDPGVTVIIPWAHSLGIDPERQSPFARWWPLRGSNPGKAVSEQCFIPLTMPEIGWRIYPSLCRRLAAVNNKISFQWTSPIQVVYKQCWWKKWRVVTSRIERGLRQYSVTSLHHVNPLTDYRMPKNIAPRSHDPSDWDPRPDPLYTSSIM